MPSPPSSFANNAVGYTYHYDQLNRLKKLRQYTGISGTATWDRSYITLNDQENITYDGNGNILTYGRNGGDTTAQTIDSLTYNYNYTGGKLLNNQLQYIHDAVSSSGYDLDIRNQTDTANYLYDGIGNLIHDSGSIIRNIGWTVYNKPDSIIEPSGIISYAYNTANQRINKSFNGLTTWYVRDAQGNVLAVYDNTHGDVNWREQHLYGSSRLGMWWPNINLADSNALDKWDTTGYRQFELDNHLGNVMTTINDVRVPYFRPSHIGPIPGPLQYFTANVLSYQDYYAFGMPMPDRQYTVDSAYRYGFNGKEQDNEVMGYANSQDYGERFYDDRIGRFRSVDPLYKKFPWNSSFAFAENRVIDGGDIDGREWKASNGENGTVNISVNVNFDVDKDTHLSQNQITEYKKAISAEFNRVLELSSNSKVHGEVTFNGGDANKLHQVVPSLNIFGTEAAPGAKFIIGGSTDFWVSNVNIYKKNGSIKSPGALAENAVHELLHTVRVGHPFEITQGNDTKLINVGVNKYMTTNTTDPNIYYNIMNYDAIFINGRKLGDLWFKKRPELITHDQLNFIINEIHLQMNGDGLPKDKNYDWLNFPGQEVKKMKLNK